MTMTRANLGQVLLQKQIVTKEQLDEAVAMQQATTPPIPLYQAIIDLGHADEAKIMQCMAETLRVRYVDLDQITPDEGLLNLIPADLRERYQCLPIRQEGRKLFIASADPSNVMARDDLRMAAKMDVELLLASPAKIASRVKTQPAEESGSLLGSIAASVQAMGKGGAGGPLDESLMAPEDDEDIAKVKELTDEAPIIRIANAIMQQAIKDTASDIHIEPQHKGLRVRYRIDGVLHEVMKIPHHVHAPLVSRVKIMSDMNIAERRIPQDGRIHIRMKKKDYDMRVSSIPTTYGEKVVMRILDKSSVLIGLDNLGIYPEVQRQLMDLCVQPNGMVLSTGPTGSGKTTTQYSILNIINSVEKNIITIEDPVEYQLAGLSQVHVNRKAGLTFANALKYFLRQDPDIIMVGEVRDLETAEIAIQASLTGHLVLSTLHTNDAASSVTRMVDMGVEPFLIAASVIGALAQRLARRICENCKEPTSPPPEALARFGLDPRRAGEVTFYRGRGCDNCRQTGYRGRLGIFELFRLNEEIADLIVRRAPLSEIRAAGRANGMVTLQEDGFQKIQDGITTVEEVMRVVMTAGF